MLVVVSVTENVDDVWMKMQWISWSQKIQNHLSTEFVVSNFIQRT